MTVFVKFIYPKGSDEEENLVSKNALDVHIDVPIGAVGFAFIEEKNLKAAKMSKERPAHFFLGNINQIVTRDIAEKYKTDIVERQLDQIKQLQCDALFIIENTAWLGLYKGDKVLDPDSRQTVYPH